LRTWFRAFTVFNAFWWKADAALWMLEEVLGAMGGRTWEMGIVDLSASPWKLVAYWYTTSGTVGGSYPVFWYDPPTGPP